MRQSVADQLTAKRSGSCLARPMMVRIAAYSSRRCKFRKREGDFIVAPIAVLGPSVRCNADPISQSR